MENDTKKVYTAEEIRQMANAVVDESDFQNANCTVVYKDIYCCGKLFRPSVIAAMLLQAAEMSERAEELKAQCLKICGRETCDHKGDKCVCCARDVIDFIVRGDNDAGKPDISVSQMAL